MRLFAISLPVLAGILSFPGGACLAQDKYPVKPIRLIVPYPPGGPTDIIGRLASGVLTKRLAENVVVDNRGGAATAIGAEMAARSPADGYTLLLSSETTFAVTPALKDKLPYHPERDFSPISLLTTQPYVLAVSLALPVSSVSQLVAHAKANPGKLTYGSAGAGGANHLAGEMFKHSAGIDILHVPYKGNGPAIIDLSGGQISMMLGSISSLYPSGTAKKIRLIAIAAAKRSSTAPELPTFGESGMPGFQVSGWNCIVAPRGTPPAVIRRLNAEVVAGFREADILDRLKGQSIDSAVGTPDELAAHIRTEFARYSKIIKAIGLKAE